MDFSLPKNILYIISGINEHGYEAHIVGGCVRDILIGRIPSDWDITTNASPRIIKSIFPKTYDTGLKHGTVTVVVENIPFEITTWRKESGYSDHRRPDHVYAADSLAEDLSRRDFTINAMAYHPEEGLIDPFGGSSDIKDNVIRCVGDPYQRFSEDALRMLRAVRFSAQLDFSIDDQTKEAIKSLSADLSHISKERIQAELNKILESPSPEKLSLLWETGLSVTVFPGIESIPPMWHTLAGHFSGSPDQRSVLLALLFHISFDSNKQERASKLLNGLKYDNETKRSVLSYLKCLDSFGQASPRNIRKAVSEFGGTVSADVFESLSIIRSQKNTDKGLSDRIRIMSPVRLSISGSDLKYAGYKGKEIKDMLSVLSLCVYEKPELNDREILTEIAQTISRLK
jgi:tRNA nucleotidyltransferase (CCA-adding enzyme)